MRTGLPRTRAREEQALLGGGIAVVVKVLDDLLCSEEYTVEYGMAILVLLGWSNCFGKGVNCHLNELEVHN